jgi:hypothetical protein
MNRREAERLTRQSDVLQSLGFTSEEADALRRISMTLRRWHEMECGTGNGCIERGHRKPLGGGKLAPFEHAEDGKPYWADHSCETVRYYPMADRETGAKKRLAAILERRNSYGDTTEHANGGCTITKRKPLSAYIQGDPRGAALYIIRPGDVPEGGSVESYYTRGICVY